jgi:hypothetical protein
MRARALVRLRETPMPENKAYPIAPETGEQVPARRHDAGSGANETVDGLDAATEALRNAIEPQRHYGMLLKRRRPVSARSRRRRFSTERTYPRKSKAIDPCM